MNDCILVTREGDIVTVTLNRPDTLNALMAIPNLVSQLLLSNVIAADTKRFLTEGNLDDAYEAPILQRR